MLYQRERLHSMFCFIFQNYCLAQSPLPTTTFYKLALRRATNMAACATFAVVICWLPCQAYSLAAQLGYVRAETVLHQVLNLLAFFNSCLNPALYAFTNDLFRKKFSEIFARVTCYVPASNDMPSTLVWVQLWPRVSQSMPKQCGSGMILTTQLGVTV